MWTILHVISAIPTFMILLRVLLVRATEARASRKYYSLCLSSVLVWTFLDAVTTNLLPEQALVASALTRLIFVAVSLAVFFFVVSSVHFTRTPSGSETLFFGSPVLVILISNLVDPFGVTLKPYGWQGNISDVLARYSWLALINAAMIYSFVKLFRVRTQVKAHDARKRLTFFLSSAISALITGVLLYLLAQALDVPSLSVIGVNFSFLLAYPAFTRMKKRISV